MLSRLVVGFDLDMTLIDSRPGIGACFRALTERTGVHVDVDLAVSRLGPPLRAELAEWFPPDRVEDAVTTFRALYPSYAVTPSLALPGAVESVAAVRAAGGRVVVVTAKLGRLARLHLDHLGIAVDEVAGDRFEDGKTTALAEYGATIYVGDHVADMRAARAAGVTAVGVPTGPCTVDDLCAAGADVVLGDLREFSAWLSGFRLPDPARAAAA